MIFHPIMIVRKSGLFESSGSFMFSRNRQKVNPEGLFYRRVGLKRFISSPVRIFMLADKLNVVSDDKNIGIQNPGKIVETGKILWLYT
jgi:hypothetical protein